MDLSLEEEFRLNGFLHTGNFAAEPDKALAWSGLPNMQKAEELRKQGYQTIADTQGGKALDQSLPYDSVLRGEVTKDDYDKYWREASSQFSKAQHGNITTLVIGAREERDFMAVELPNFVDDKKVTSINGVQREQIQETYHANHEEGFKKVCEAEQANTFEKQNDKAEIKQEQVQQKDDRLKYAVSAVLESEKIEQWQPREVVPHSVGERVEVIRMRDLERDRNAALDRMSEDRKAGRDINDKDIERLNPKDLQNIKERGDAALQELIKQRELEREREQERNRERH